MSWDFFNARIVTARKTYRCEEAGCEIKPGQRYSYGFGKNEGEPMDQRLCLACELISTELMLAFGYDEGFPVGECRRVLREDHGVTEDPIAWATRHREARRAKCEAAKVARAKAERYENLRRRAVADVFAERERQVSGEGWATGHDDEHDDGALAVAAACYAAPEAVHWGSWLTRGARTLRWPWDRRWWKPKDRRADLVRAGALIIAEIERLDRASDLQPETAGQAPQV